MARIPDLTGPLWTYQQLTEALSIATGNLVAVVFYHLATLTPVLGLLVPCV